VTGTGEWWARLTATEGVGWSSPVLCQIVRLCAMRLLLPVPADPGASIVFLLFS